ncbi:hypothetical protein D9M72_501360 [compost metagenome]
MRKRSQLRRDTLAGIEAHNRDARVGGLLQDIFEGFGLGERDRDAVDLLIYCLLDELSLTPGFGVGRVEEFNVVLRRRFLGTLADDVPEGITRGRVGDESHLDAVRACGLATTCAAARLGGLSAGA